MNLIERIKAAIDEDEQVANAAIEQVGDGDWEQRGTRIARHDPARVLRQVEGARKILARHQPDAEWCGSCAEQDDYDNLFIVWPCPTILALAEMFGVDLNEA